MNIHICDKNSTSSAKKNSDELLIDSALNEIFDEEPNRECYSYTKGEIQEAKRENFSDILASFDLQRQLNPMVWDNGELISKVRMKLLDIADDFIDYLDVDWVKPVDIIFIGSLANYNWSKYSDFDIHIVYDYSEIDERTEFVSDYFNSKRYLWNDEHENLKIYGFPVELSVQDVNADFTASGIYSLNKDKWIKEPEKDEFKSAILDKSLIKEKALEFVRKINKLTDKFKEETDKEKLSELEETVKKLLEKMKGVRTDALKTGNEMSIGNLVWKALKRCGYTDKLFNLKAKIYDKLNSIYQ